jgi:hypothetical protein
MVFLFQVDQVNWAPSCELKCLQPIRSLINAVPVEAEVICNLSDLLSPEKVEDAVVQREVGLLYWLINKRLPACEIVFFLLGRLKLHVFIWILDVYLIFWYSWSNLVSSIGKYTPKYHSSSKCCSRDCYVTNLVFSPLAASSRSVSGIRCLNCRLRYRKHGI